MVLIRLKMSNLQVEGCEKLKTIIGTRLGIAVFSCQKIFLVSFGEIFSEKLLKNRKFMFAIFLFCYFQTTKWTPFFVKKNLWKLFNAWNHFSCQNHLIAVSTLRMGLKFLFIKNCCVKQSFCVNWSKILIAVARWK